MLVSLAGMTDSGEGGEAAVLLLVPGLLGGVLLMAGGLLAGASSSLEGVVVRLPFRKKLFPRGSSARIDEDTMEMLPVSYSYIVVVTPDGDEHRLAQFAQYSFVERRRGGLQKKADRLNGWLRADD